MNILITGSTFANAYKLKRLLERENSVFLADATELPEFLLKGSSFIKIPGAHSNTFVHEMLKICLDNSIERVYPLLKQEIKALADAIQLFEEYGIELMIPAKDQIAELLPLEVYSGREIVVIAHGECVATTAANNPKIPADTERGVFWTNKENTAFNIFTAD
ncbi:hypothetical protein [Rubrolithibacter danxiaensis]|uniref:hypothetical protein n=1 Tax=Rubrolithibacter danxiaensis TaxID=3390805 RepID=UPI003BF894B8